MTPSQVRNEINRLMQFLLEERLAADANRTIIHDLGGNRKRVSWVGNRGEQSPTYEGPFVEEYIRLLADREFTVLLADYSLLQISYLFRRRAIARHRLCYFPCPIDSDEDEIPIGELEEYILDLKAAELLSTIRLRSPIRFDYDPDHGGEGHPISHVTISMRSCRIPVFAPMSIGHFTRFVFSNFYPASLASTDRFRSWPLKWFDNTLTSGERLSLHLACREEE